MDYVHGNDYLKNQQGKYAEPYSVYSPWVHRIDFGYKHDFVLNVGKDTHMLQLSFDMKNVMNLFNSSWGVAKYLNPELVPKHASSGMKVWMPMVWQPSLRQLRLMEIPKHSRQATHWVSAGML